MWANRYLILWSLLGLLVSSPLLAHKLRVFATAEGDKILGQAYFVGGARASGAVITLTDAEGHELARLKPDEQGEFSYPVERRMAYRVVADSGDGHLASWTLQADEFSPSLPEAATSKPPASDIATKQAPKRTTPAATQVREPASVEQIEQVVARQVRPLREALQSYEERVRLRDIVGGVGYIIGLAGLGLWWRSRHGERG